MTVGSSLPVNLGVVLAVDTLGVGEDGRAQTEREHPDHRDDVNGPAGRGGE